VPAACNGRSKRQRATGSLRLLGQAHETYPDCKSLGTYEHSALAVVPHVPGQTLAGVAAAVSSMVAQDNIWYLPVHIF